MDEETWLNFYAKYRYLKELDIEIQSKVITKGILEAAKIIFDKDDEYRNNAMDS